MQIRGELSSSLDKIINTEFQTFVQNRVADIRKILVSRDGTIPSLQLIMQCCFHVSTKERFY